MREATAIGRFNIPSFLSLPVETGLLWQVFATLATGAPLTADATLATGSRHTVWYTPSATIDPARFSHEYVYM